MRRDVTPPATLLLVAAGFVGGHFSQGEGGSGVLLGALGVLGIWGVLERVVRARAPRIVGRALDVLVVNGILLIAATYFAYGASSLRVLVQVLTVAQFSRVIRRKTVRDLTLMHGTAVAQVALAAFLTRDVVFLPLLGVTALVGVAASLGVIDRQAERVGDVRIFTVRARGRAGARAAVGRVGLPVVLALSVLVCGGVLFVALPRGPLFRELEEAKWRNQVVDPNDYSADREEGRDAVIGFTGRVRLGEIGRIKATPWSAFFVRMQTRDPVGGQARGLPLPDRMLYFRGVAHDTFTGRAWARSSTLLAETRWLKTERVPGTLRVERSVVDGRSPSRIVVQDYEMEASTSSVLFGLDRMESIELTEALPRVWWRGEHSLATGRAHREGFGYRVTSRCPLDPQVSPFHDTITESTRARCLRMPEGSERIRELARRLAGEGSGLVRGRRLSQWLRENCSYTLLFREWPAGKPLETFLFETRTGHCEYFATALAMLLRGSGVPSRLVVGYRGGQWFESEQGYLVRQKDAHTWVEAWTDRGWVRLDPTPGDPEAIQVAKQRIPGREPDLPESGSDGNLLTALREFGPEERAMVLAAATDALVFVVQEGFGVDRPERSFPPPLLVLVLGGLGLAASVRLLRLRPFRTALVSRRRGAAGRSVEAEASFYEDAVRILRQRGYVRRASQSPREFERVVSRFLGEHAVAFLTITVAFERVRYGGRRVAPAEAGRLRGLVERLARPPEDAGE